MISRGASAFIVSVFFAGFSFHFLFIGDGTQVGAGTLVISDLPAHCVAVGVPARIIGSFVDVTQQPSIGMDQMMDNSEKIITFETEGI